MKFKILSWEEGETEDHDQCIFATILCRPNWLKRTFLRSKFFDLNLYGQSYGFGFYWFNSDSGKNLIWSDGSRSLLAFVNDRRIQIENNNKAKKMLTKINKAVKT